MNLLSVTQPYLSHCKTNGNLFELYSELVCAWCVDYI